MQGKANQKHSKEALQLHGGGGSIGQANRTPLKRALAFSLSKSNPLGTGTSIARWRGFNKTGKSNPLGTGTSIAWWCKFNRAGKSQIETTRNRRFHLFGLVGQGGMPAAGGGVRWKQALAFSPSESNPLEAGALIARWCEFNTCRTSRSKRHFH